MTMKKRRFLSEDHIYRDLATGLILLLLLSPMLVYFPGWSHLDDYLTAAFLLFALYQITRRASDIAIGLGLGLPAIIAGIVNTQTPDTPVMNLAPTVLGGLFVGFLIWRILKDVSTDTRKTGERISGAICTYLLLGFLFTTLYGFAALIDENAFSVSEDLEARWQEGDPSRRGEILTYFSFVTMTTLGYGDISPVSPAVRTLAWLQSLIGQLYLAVAIAGLVGIHISKKDHPDQRE